MQGGAWVEHAGGVGRVAHEHQVCRGVDSGRVEHEPVFGAQHEPVGGAPGGRERLGGLGELRFDDQRSAALDRAGDEGERLGTPGGRQHHRRVDPVSAGDRVAGRRRVGVGAEPGDAVGEFAGQPGGRRGQAHVDREVDEVGTVADVVVAVVCVAGACVVVVCVADGRLLIGRRAWVDGGHGAHRPGIGDRHELMHRIRECRREQRRPSPVRVQVGGVHGGATGAGGVEGETFGTAGEVPGRRGAVTGVGAGAVELVTAHGGAGGAEQAVDGECGVAVAEGEARLHGGASGQHPDHRPAVERRAQVEQTGAFGHRRQT